MSEMQRIDTSIYQMPDPPSAMDNMKSALDMQSKAQDLQQKKLTMAVGQQNYMSNVLGSLYSKADLAHSDIIAEGTKAVRMGILAPQQLATELSNMPQDPAQLRQWVGQQSLRAGTLAQQLQAHAGIPGTTNNGAYDLATNTNPMTGARTYAPGGAGAVPMQISPGQSMQRVESIDPNTGAQRSLPTAVVSAGEGTLTRGGSVPVAAPNAQPQNMLVSPPASAPARQAPGNKLGVTARPAPSLPPQIDQSIPVQRAPDPAARAPVQNSPYGGLPTSVGPGLQTGLAPGQSQAATVTADASAKQGAALQQAADQATQSKSLLADMEKHVDGLSLGPMASKARTVGGVINQGANAMGYKSPFTSVAAQEQFVKQAEQLRQQQALALGGTDATLSSAGASSPNEGYTTDGVKGMISTLKGNQDAILIKNQEWQKWKQTHGADSYGAFQQDFNNKFEPRVFALPYMAPDAAKKMLSSLSPAEGAKVDQAYRIAVQNGWIKRVKGE